MHSSIPPSTIIEVVMVTQAHQKGRTRKNSDTTSSQASRVLLIPTSIMVNRPGPEEDMWQFLGFLKIVSRRAKSYVELSDPGTGENCN